MGSGVTLPVDINAHIVATIMAKKSSAHGRLLVRAEGERGVACVRIMARFRVVCSNRLTRGAVYL